MCLFMIHMHTEFCNLCACIRDHVSGIPAGYRAIESAGHTSNQPMKFLLDVMYIPNLVIFRVRSGCQVCDQKKIIIWTDPVGPLTRQCSSSN